MRDERETPEDRREGLRQEELKKSSSSIHGSNLSDLVGSLGWRVTGIIILICILAIVIYAAFFR